MTIVVALAAAGCGDSDDNTHPATSSSPAAPQVLEPPEPITDQDAFFATLSTDPCNDALTDGVTRIVAVWAQTHIDDPDDVTIDASPGTGPTGLPQCVFTLGLPDNAAAEVRIDTLTITALPAAKNPVSATPPPEPAGLDISHLERASELAPEVRVEDRVGVDAIALAAETVFAATGYAFTAGCTSAPGPCLQLRDPARVDAGTSWFDAPWKAATAISETLWAHLQTTNDGRDNPAAVPGYLIEAEYPPAGFTLHATRFNLPRDIKNWFDGTP